MILLSNNFWLLLRETLPKEQAIYVSNYEKDVIEFRCVLFMRSARTSLIDSQ